MNLLKVIIGNTRAEVMDMVVTNVAAEATQDAGQFINDAPGAQKRHNSTRGPVPSRFLKLVVE